MDSEINLRTMYDSIGKALGAVQEVTPRIRDQALQFACDQIISALDDIERAQTRSDAGVSNHLPPHIRQQIDLNKQKFVRLLLEIGLAAKIPVQLPSRLEQTTFGDQSRRTKDR